MGFGLLEIGSGILYVFFLAVFSVFYLFALSDVTEGDREGRWHAGVLGKTWQYAVTGAVLSVFPCWISQGYSTLKFFFGKPSYSGEMAFTFTAVFLFWAVPLAASAFWVRNVRYSSAGGTSRTFAYFLALTAWFAWGFDFTNEATLSYFGAPSAWLR